MSTPIALDNYTFSWDEDKLCVYVLLGGIDYEGYTLLGVYSTPEAAETAKRSAQCANHSPFDDHLVEEVDLNEPPYSRP